MADETTTPNTFGGGRRRCTGRTVLWLLTVWGWNLRGLRAKNGATYPP